MSAKPKSKTISEQDYLILVSDLNSARMYYRSLLDTEARVAKRLPFPDAPAHINAAVFGEIGADELLERLGVTVEPKRKVLNIK